MTTHSAFLTCTAVVVLIAGSAAAQTITFSGRDWETNPAFHRDCTVDATYVPVDLDTDGFDEACEMTSVFAADAIDDTAMVTLFHLVPGDVVAYDVKMPIEVRDLCGDGDLDWFADTFSGFATSVFGDDWIGPLNDDHQRITARIGWGFWGAPRESELWILDEPGNTTYAGVDVTQGVHMEWTFTDDTNILLRVYDLSGSLLVEHPMAIWTGYTLADLDGFRIGLWDAEQTLTISNFEINPTSDCPPDFNGDGALNSQDFIAFLNAFTAGDPSADYNGDGAINSQDFVAFLNDFVAGC